MESSENKESDMDEKSNKESSENQKTDKKEKTDKKKKSGKKNDSSEETDSDDFEVQAIIDHLEGPFGLVCFDWNFIALLRVHIGDLCEML